MALKPTFSRALTLVSALVVAAALAYSAPGYFSREKQPENAQSEPIPAPEDIMQAFRTERADVRQLETLQLNALANDEGADAQVRARARSQLLALTESMEAETTLEGVLRLRGFEDAVVTVHADSVNVLVRAKALSQSESAMILELVMRETGQSGGNVKIMTTAG